MLDVSLTVEGADEVAEDLLHLPEVLGNQVEQAIDRLLLLAQGMLAIYPAAPAGSRYRRTGLLGGNWTGATHRVRRIIRPTGLYVEGQIQNARPGVQYVQDEDDQAWMHVGRWKTAQQVLSELQSEADRLLGAAGNRALETVEGV